MDEHSQSENGSGGKAGRWVFWGFVLVVVFFLFTEHRAHFFGILPYLLLLACPLMHLFHRHGGHGQGNHSGTTSVEGSTQKPDYEHRH